MITSRLFFATLAVVGVSMDTAGATAQDPANSVLHAAMQFAIEDARQENRLVGPVHLDPRPLLVEWTPLPKRKLAPEWRINTPRNEIKQGQPRAPSQLMRITGNLPVTLANWDDILRCTGNDRPGCRMTSEGLLVRISEPLMQGSEAHVYIEERWPDPSRGRGQGIYTGRGSILKLVREDQGWKVAEHYPIVTG